METIILDTTSIEAILTGIETFHEENLLFYEDIKRAIMLCTGIILGGLGGLALWLNLK